MNKPPLIIIAGPTAAGKTALSVGLAEQISGEVISADSMQVYRGMDIGTAKIRPEETRGVKHHLIDCLSPRHPFNVMEFRALAKQAVRSCLEAGHVPVLTGGTGFYIQSVLYDVDFQEESGSEEIREALTRDMDTLGPEAMHRRLREVDPEAAEQIHMNNRKRVIRALEFYALTGRKISDSNREQREKESPYRYLYYVVTMDRQRLYQRIDQRVDRMMEEGLLREVQGLKDMGLDRSLVSMQGLGYRQLLDYLDGLCTLPEAVERIKTETRHFAKRQLTWFRREPEARWLQLEDFGGSPEALLAHVVSECRSFLAGENLPG